MRFNGASLFRARKRVSRADPSRPCLGFNGASLFRARKRSTHQFFSPATPRLQWGLTLSSEETGRHCGRGDCRVVLQWGLTLSSEETSTSGTDFFRGLGFNGASLFRARKRGNRSRGVIGRGRFNGASLFRARKRVPLPHQRGCPRASMGPHSFERGNQDKFQI